MPIWHAHRLLCIPCNRIWSGQAVSYLIYKLNTNTTKHHVLFLALASVFFWDYFEYCIFNLFSMARTHQGGSGKAEYEDPSPGPVLDVNEFRLWSFYRAIVAEFVATFLFVYITVSTIIGKANQKNPCAGVGTLGISWCVGGMIFILVYCTAGISGGHINPAVTFGMLVARKVSLNRAVLYIVAQCFGAICGAGMVKALQKTYYSTGGGGVNAVSEGYTNETALAAEIIGTFVLVYTVFSATDPKRNARDSHVPVLAPLPIGFAVIVVHFATIHITGTGINPARSFGPAVVYGHQKSWDDHWIFWVGPLIGAALAAAYHQYVLRATGFKTWAPSVDNSLRPPVPAKGEQFKDLGILP